MARGPTSVIAAEQPRPDRVWDRPRAEGASSPSRGARTLVYFLDVFMLVLVPVSFSFFLLLGVHGTGVLGFDFRGTLWDPGQAILSGASPYPPPDPDAIRTGNPAVYPPAVMLLVAPLTLLPWSVGIAVWLVLSVIAAGIAFWLLDVRDWRVYVVGFASAPFLIGLVHGNLTVILLLGIAAAWRWRDRPLITGLSVAALVVAKIFLWPLLIWLLVTRRLKGAVIALAAAAVATLGSWAIIGFDGFGDYPDLLRALDHVYTRHTQSLSAFGIALGLSDSAAKALALGAALTVIGAGAWLVRRGDGDRRMFTAVLLAGIIASPIAWMYYYTLLLVPVALYRRTLSRVWWLTSAFWAPVLVGAITGPTAPCCRPPGMPKPAWLTLTTDPPIGLLIGCILLLSATVVVTLRRRQRVAARALPAA